MASQEQEDVGHGRERSVAPGSSSEKKTGEVSELSCPGVGSGRERGVSGCVSLHKVQYALENLGYLSQADEFSEARDGFRNVPGSKTMQAFETFQREHNLKPNGKIDRTTADKIISISDEFVDQLRTAFSSYWQSPSDATEQAIFSVIRKYRKDANEIIHKLNASRDNGRLNVCKSSLGILIGGCGG